MKKPSDVVTRKEVAVKKMLLAVYLIIALMISSCGAQPAAETATPLPTETPVPTLTQLQSPTIPPTEEATDVPPTLETPVPTNPPDCTNSASFVADVTIPDNSNIGSGEAFTKTWRIANTGTCVWGPDYTLDHYSEETMSAPASSPLSVTFPGETADLSLELTAPTDPGTHRSNFVIKNPAGLIMSIDDDSRLWLIINVTSAAAGAATPTATAGSGIPTPTSGSGISTATSGASASADTACAFTTDAAKVTEAINAVNAYRAENGLPPYAANALLNNAASAHANDLACNNLFGHKGSDGSTPASRVAVSGYAASAVSENVYGSYPPLSGLEVVDWWANDKTDLNHNLNLLSTKYKDIGVAYSFFDNFGYYVIVFAAPK